MKKFLALSMLAVTVCANATNNSNGPTGGDGGNGYGGNGFGGAGGSGVGVGVGIAGSESSAKSSADATAIQGQFQAQQQGQIATGGDSKASATGGASHSNATGGLSYATGGNAVGGNSGGNSISVTGATYDAAASTAYAPESKAPRTSCRLFVGIGGTSVNGALSGGIPIGNDQTCLSGAQIEFMNNVNKVAPGTFTGPDYLKAACAVEGMEAMSACKR